MSAYDNLPQPIQDALDGQSWPHAKELVKNAAKAAPSIKAMTFGQVCDLILFGHEATPGTPQDDERWALINACIKIEQACDKSFFTPKNQNP